MTLLTLLISIVAAYLVMHIYAEDNRRYPPMSTRRGKEARIVSVIVLIPLAGTLIYRMTNSGSEHSDRYWIGALFIGAGIPIYRYIQFRNRQK
jgi:hypothetical protein